MKKTILLFLTVLFAHIIYGQNGVTSQDKKNYLYAIRLTGFQFSITHSEDGICYNYVEVSARLNDNTSQAMLNFGDHNYSFPDRIFLFNKDVENIRIYAESVDKTSRPWPLSNSCDQRAIVNQNISNIPVCDSKYFNATASHSDVRNRIYFTYTLIPLHTLNPELINGMPNTYLPIDDKVTLLAKSGFPSGLYHYQYRLQGESTWNDISGSLYNANKLTFSARDILGNSYEDHLGEKVEFRVVSCYKSGTYLSFSDPVLLTLIQSSPHIINSSASPVKCYDSQDGGITLNFDRTLLSGETLEYSLKNTVTGTAHSTGYLTNLLQSSTTVTVDNLPPGNYQLDLLGTYNGKPTYTDGARHSETFEIKRPTAVTAAFVSKTDVFCHQGSDGIINLSAAGGQNKYQYSLTGDNGINSGWTDFTGGNNTSISNLPAGTYRITVQDSNLCPAKKNGSVKVITVTVTEPSAPIALSELEIKEPTGYGLSNGYISVRVTGGTPNNDGSYNFEWRKDSPSGTVISANIITDATNNPFTIKLGDIPKGKYYLTVKDKNYAGASSNLNTCGIISREYEVNQPDSLIATIDVKKIIFCHINNDYDYKLDLDNNGIPDEAETGELKAIVTGGVGTYTYQWQKLEGGSFQDMAGATSNTLTKLQEGTYKVLVTDVNGNKADAGKIFNYPEVLKISLSASTILCNNRNDGTVSVTATGGTEPYTYYWNTSDTTPGVTGLGAGNYFVMVQDANGCTVSGSVRIEQPGALEIEDIHVQNPICNGASNGEIQIRASGGKAPYSIIWSNGMTGENLSGLKAGAYTVTFTDANGCSMTKSYNLTDPEALTIDLGKDITLCRGDSQIYDIKTDDPAATYQWTDIQGNVIGTDSSIELSAAGIYTAQVIDSKGCTATDQIEIKTSEEVLSPEFMIASHAFVDRTVELVNTSTTRPERVEWVLPESNYITIVSESEEHIELKFSQVGSYQIGLKGMQGLCDKTMYKNILIEENTGGVEEPAAASSNIKDFTILPNPNNGDYKVVVKLHREAPIRLRIVSMSGSEPYRAAAYPESSEFDIPFNRSLTTGVYLIILETGTEVQVRRMLVNH